MMRHFFKLIFFFNFIVIIFLMDYLEIYSYFFFYEILHTFMVIYNFSTKKIYFLILLNTFCVYTMEKIHSLRHSNFYHMFLICLYIGKKKTTKTATNSEIFLVQFCKNEISCLQKKNAH